MAFIIFAATVVATSAQKVNSTPIPACDNQPVAANKTDKIQPSTAPVLNIRERSAQRETLNKKAKEDSKAGKLIFVLSTTPKEEQDRPAEVYRQKIKAYLASQGMCAEVYTLPNNTPDNTSTVIAFGNGKGIETTELINLNRAFLDMVATKYNCQSTRGEIKPSKEPRLSIKERMALTDKLDAQAKTMSADGALVFTLTTTPAEELKIPAAEYKKQIECYYAEMGIKAVVLTAPNNTLLDKSVVGAFIAGKGAGFIDLTKIDSTFLDSLADKLKAAKLGQPKQD